MKKILITLSIVLIGLITNAQTPKPKLIEGSIMVFNNFHNKIGFGAVSPAFLKVNLTKKFTIGTALAPIIWFDTEKHNHNFGQAGFVIRADYKRISIGCNLLTIAGIDSKFIGIGVKL